MRKDPLVTGNYYHVYNRGTDKRDIFGDEKDVERFLLNMKLFAKIAPTGSIRDILELELNSPDVEHRGNEGEQRLVSIVEYCLNPNHFHFILKQEVDGGISEFMKRMGGYTGYFNRKNKRSGALFQGKFKSVYVGDDEYFRVLCAYVMWNNKMHDLPKSKLSLVRSSLEEYQTGKYFIVNQVEAENVLAMFGGFKDLTKHASEIISILREGRGKKDFDSATGVTCDFHED